MHPRAAQLSSIASLLEVAPPESTASLIASGQNLVRGMKARNEIVEDHEEWLGTAARFLRAWARHDAKAHDELVTFAAGLEGIAEAMTGSEYGSGVAPNRLLTGWVDEPLN